MLYLGISEDLFDSGVTLCDGERILFASNEERYTRRKNEGGFPEKSLEALLQRTGVAPEDIDVTCFSGIMTPPLPVRIFPSLHKRAFDAKRDKRTSTLRNLIDAVTFLTPMSHTSQKSLSRSMVKWLLPAVMRFMLPSEFRKASLRFVDHHQAHAAAAYFLSGFEKALVVTADGMGDGLSLTVCSYASPDQHERLWSATSRDSFGLFFEVLTEAFGFTPCRDEGKLTGLAAHGNPAHIMEPRPFTFSDGTLAYTGPYGKQGVYWAKEHLLRQYSREDIAAWAQDILESLIVETAQASLQKTGHTKLAAAGGVFANVKLNQRLHELPEVESLFVCPNMGDGGLSLGAICECGGLAPQRIEHVFLGDAFTDDEMRAALERAGLAAEPCDNIETQCAQMVAEDKIVARFTGAMEWGPRALGNRSILARTTDPAVHERLNTLLSRSDFMPFAPAVLADKADKCFLCIDGARFTARYMNMCFDCTDYMKNVASGCVHVDGTARPQLVRRADNPDMHAILTAFEKRTGVPVLINTSFNMHEEPIVMTPDDALRAFEDSGFTYLAIGPFLVERHKA